jgi:colanic acid biosynthesis protein WcaH
LSIESNRAIKSFLKDDCFKTIIDNTPLISIDLIVRNQQGCILLGNRLNKPAKGFWFVPGGRIRKNESLSTAFRRLTLNELGIAMSLEKARYLGLYEHFYNDSIYTFETTNESISTHYVVNCFEVMISSEKITLPTVQHDSYEWFTEAELMASPSVHVHSKWYFNNDKGFL